MRALLIVFLITGLLLGCDNEVERPKTPEELKAELKQQEVMFPLDYLLVEEVTLQPQQKKTRNAGLFRDAEYEDDGAIIEGYIRNKATLATFKDAVVKVSFYSQTKTLVEENSYVLYEYYNANSINKFSIKVETPNHYKSFGFKITDAEAK